MAVPFVDLSPTPSATMQEDLTVSFDRTDEIQNLQSYTVGDVTDDNDATHIILPSKQRADGTVVAQSLAGVFHMPPGLIPIALLFHVRMRNADDVLTTPPDGTRAIQQTLANDATDVILYRDSLVNTRADQPITPLRNATVTTAGWFDWFWNLPVDLNDPTDAGGWLDVTTTLPEAAAALTGPGLRATFGIWHENPTREDWREWLDVFEYRLRVAYKSGGSPPEVIYPRNDGLATGSADVLYPQPDSYQASGLTYGGYW